MPIVAYIMTKKFYNIEDGCQIFKMFTLLLKLTLP